MTCPGKAEADSFRLNDRAIKKAGIGKSNIEETQQQANGNVVILLTSKVPLKNHANQVIGILGIYTDITEFKNAQKTIKEQESLLVSASQLSSLGEMAGGIAHEINNPLSIIKASTKYLSKVMDRPLTEATMAQMKETIQEMDETVERIAKIVMGLRNISRTSEGEKDYCCFKDILSDVLSVAKERFKASGIKIKENFSDDALEVSFRTQRIQISQVIINLLNNSFDALKEIESDNKWIEIGVNYNAKYISFYVADEKNGGTLIYDSLFLILSLPFSSHDFNAPFLRLISTYNKAHELHLITCDKPEVNHEILLFCWPDSLSF